VACGTSANHRDDPVLPAPEPFQVTDLGPGECHGIAADGSVVGVNADGPFLIGPLGERKSLGALDGGGAIVPLAVNGSGIVVGLEESAAGRRAVAYRDGAWSRLGDDDSGLAVALDVNDAGAIVGIRFSGTGEDEDVEQRGFWTEQGETHSMDGPLASAAHRIAANGDFIGILETDSGQTHAFLQSSGTARDLGTLGGPNSAAYGMNNQGDVVGVADTAKGKAHAFLFSGGVMKDLGTLGGDRSDARGVDDSGLVVGNSFDADGVAHPFATHGGSLVDVTPKDGKGRPFVHARIESVVKGTAVGWGVALDGEPRCLRWVLSL
jgi:probable HAF family extracellular repeat protein